MLREKYLTNWCMMVVILMVLAANATAQIYVDAAATGANDGSSWDDAYIDLQDALDVALAGDEIWVAASIYKPTKLEFADYPRSATFQLISGVALLGGFGGETILSGDIGISGDNSDNCYHVVTGSFTDVSAVIEGFTIEGGCADGPWDIDGIDPPERYDQGGGMFNFLGGPTVNHCIFQGNYALLHGGAVENRGANSSPKFNHCTFNTNSAVQYGGGMYNAPGSSTEFSNCVFNGNSAGLHGGGMNTNQGNTEVSNCEFNGNFAEQAGGGMVIDRSIAVLTNCKFHDNTAQNLNGGGLVVWECDPELTDCKFHGNFALYGGGFAAGYLCDAKLSNCEFNGNTAMLGGGVIAYMSNPELIDCKINDNTASVCGGGMNIFFSSSPILTGCKINDNSAPAGAGMFNDIGCNPELTDCEFNGNLAENEGGGMYNDGGAILTDCILQGNHSGDLGGGMANGSSSTVILEHCLLWGNTAVNATGEFAQISDNGFPVINNSCIQGWTGYFGGANNTGKKSEYIK
ncbi:MAG: hypothetical protein AMJ79_14030 [Phycisphaerae bacterium SM23_30]|nr:MAG: hypothetical protein AMJ79_14030 [Phycisphaerae bacterium SM23_30]